MKYAAEKRSVRALVAIVLDVLSKEGALTSEDWDEVCDKLHGVSAAQIRALALDLLLRVDLATDADHGLHCGEAVIAEYRERKGRE